jgi:hypothetical protein
MLNTSNEGTSERTQKTISQKKVDASLGRDREGRSDDESGKEGDRTCDKRGMCSRERDTADRGYTHHPITSRSKETCYAVSHFTLC